MDVLLDLLCEVMKKFEPVDWVIFILAFIIAATLSATAVYTVIHKLPLTAIKADIVDRIYVSVLSIIALYVGSKVAHKNKKDDV